MERSLILGVFVLGALGWMAGVAAGPVFAPSRWRTIPIGSLILAVVVPLLVVVVTVAIPASGPGQRVWAEAFFMGAAAALLAGWTMVASQISPGPAAILRSAAPRFLSLAALAAAALWLGEARPDALVGVATGWVVVTAVLWSGLGSAIGGEGRGVDVLSGAATFVVVTAAVAALGVFRETETQPLRWLAAALTFAAGVPLLSLLFGLGRSPGIGMSRSVVASTLLRLVGVVLLLGLAWLLGDRLVGQPRVLHAAGLGVLLGIIVWGLDRERSRSQLGPAVQGALLTGGLVAALVVLAAFMGAFYLLAGFGVGLALLAALFVAGLAADDGGPGSFREAFGMPLAFGALLLVYRLFVTRLSGDVSGPPLGDHFAIFGIVGGALIPWVLGGTSGLADDPVERTASETARLFRLIAALVLTAVVPFALLVLWGPKIVPGMLVGLALSAVALRPGEPRAALSAALFGIAVALLLTQWTHDVASLAALTRAERVRLLTWIAGGVLVALIVADYVVRALAHRPRGAGSPVRPTTETGL